MFPQFTVKGNPAIYKDSILNFVSSFADAVFLDSHVEVGVANIPYTGVKYSYIAAAGISDVIHADHNSLEQLEHFIETSQQKQEWVFGFISYDFKNELEKLSSENPDATNFPLFHFFSAKHVFIAKQDGITVIDDQDPELLWKKIADPGPVTETPPPFEPEFRISHVLNRDSYLASIKRLLNHIQQGDIYEINYCHEIIIETSYVDAINVYRRISEISPNPFSCYYQTRGLHLMCGSPERFLTKRGNQLISQPIKGTAARGKSKNDDELNRNRLMTSEKERSENVMIVDLVRNDLSKVAEKGTVKVEELCGIYTFPKVHQMISTVSCEVRRGTHFMDIIRAMFPMGSMTGAPKISAMKLIDQYENFKRSLFSGSVGYIDPSGDFDFNVVIRSILFRECDGVASIAAGSAITAASDPEQEYYETLVKISPQLQALGLDADKILHEISDGHAV